MRFKCPISAIECEDCGYKEESGGNCFLDALIMVLERIAGEED